MDKKLQKKKSHKNSPLFCQSPLDIDIVHPLVDFQINKD